MNTLLIGFGYKARRGKDTVAQTIIEHFGNDKQVIKRYAFADALRAEVHEAAQRAGGMFGLFMEMGHMLPSWVKYDNNAPVEPLYPLGKQRDLLQWWGTEYRRAQDPFYWVKRLDWRLKEEQPNVALITDMRFLNEFLYVQHMGGVTVKVERLGYQDANILTTHPSETGLDGIQFDYEILAPDGDVEELKRDAVRLFEIIKESLNPPPMDYVVRLDTTDPYPVQ